MTDIKKINEDLEYARYHCTSSKGKDAINDALDLINRQQETIKTLRNCVEQHHIIRKDGKSPLSLLTEEIKADAIKKLIDRLEFDYTFEIQKGDGYWEKVVRLESIKEVGKEVSDYKI